MSEMTKKKALTKNEVMDALAESAGITKQQVNAVFDGLVNLISENLREDGPGYVNIPGLMKVKVTRKPATPERTGLDPFTKQERVFKAKPAQNVVRIMPLKRLKDAV
jgi:nucleoid DNA-binding protein